MVPSDGGTSPNMSAHPPSPWYVPKPTGIGPLPPSPYAQHFPHSLSPPGWGGGRSLLPISAEEFITGTAGPCWGGQATRKINLFLPSLQSRHPSLSQLAGRDSPLWGTGGCSAWGQLCKPKCFPLQRFQPFIQKGSWGAPSHTALGTGGAFSAQPLEGAPQPGGGEGAPLSPGSAGL